MKSCYAISRVPSGANGSATESLRNGHATVRLADVAPRKGWKLGQLRDAAVAAPRALGGGFELEFQRSAP
jgi:hypothetical protein